MKDKAYDEPKTVEQVQQMTYDRKNEKKRLNWKH